jgi:hypothetical protein
MVNVVAAIDLTDAPGAGAAAYRMLRIDSFFRAADGADGGS